jgi:hypothetical protein
MNRILDALRKSFAWMAHHFDAALLLAAAVEIPRWTVTFLAIHEPLWVGIPLGALLAYATSEGWKAYFLAPRRYKLLTFNVVSLAAATFVITPVLFSMASAPINEIDLAALLPPMWLLAWAGVLAVTTFAPLIQLAAVKSVPANTPLETPAELPTLNDTTPAPIVAPVPAQSHSEAAGKTRKPRKVAKTGKLTQEQRRAQILSAGLQTSADVQRIFTVSKRTADGDLAEVRKALLQTNGNGAH